MARTSIDALNLNKAEGDSNTASRHSGAMAPQATFYKPSYRMLNHITWSSDVSGQVNFGQAIGNTGQKLFDNMASLKENEVLSSKYDEIHKSLQEKSQAWKAQSETGEGYLEYISAEHAKLAENALSGILDPVFAGRMRNMLMRSKADWENGAFEEEQAMRTAYSLRTAQQTITNLNFDVSNNPATYESGLEALKNALAGYREVAGVQAFNKVYDEALKNFTYSYGLGLVQKDPANFERLAKDGRLSVISPERIMHLQHMAMDELKRRAFESKKAEKLVELASLKDQLVSSIEAVKKMDEDGAESVTKTMTESMQLPSGMEKFLNQTQDNVRKSDIETMQKINSMVESVKSGNGIGTFESKDQLAFLPLMLPTDKNGTPSQSFSDRITAAKHLGVTATDKALSYEIGASLLYSDNAEKIQKAVYARNLSDSMNGVLLAEEDPKERYIRGQVQFRGGNDPQTILRVRDEAKDRYEKNVSDPSRREMLATQAESYMQSGEYKKLSDKAWKRILSESLDSSDWFGLSKQEKETQRQFLLFFKGRLKELLPVGWTPQEAANEAIDNFNAVHGPTSVVPGKMMFNPPEKVYSFTPQVLKKKFKRFVEDVVTGYSERKYKPSGFELRMSPLTNGLQYRTGDSSWTDATPDLEWNSKDEVYNVFFNTKEGERVYFTANTAEFAFIKLDFNAQSEEPTSTKDTKNAKKSNS